MRRRPQASIVATPVLVGAVTLLVTIVAVFLAYNANEGLPFVPTYEVQAELPSGAKLVTGNAVRIGGRRVGQVGRLRTRTIERGGRPVTIALAELVLDKQVQPLPVDTAVLVRPQSALGLKYVEIVPGRSDHDLLAGGTLPLANARAPVELEDVLSTFDAESRVASRAALEGYGDAFAGRGPDLNVALGELRPFVEHLEPVMRVLSAPSTELDQLFRQIEAVATQVAPVAEVQAELFAKAADTFAALSRDPEALRQTIARSPETLAVGTRSLAVQRPFLTQFAALSRELEPASRELSHALPPLNAALRTGAPVLADAPGTNRLVGGLLRELDQLTAQPTTLLALQDLDTLIDVGEPLLTFVAPYQTVCNYLVYFFTPLADHLSEEVPGGTIERVQVVFGNQAQDNGLSHSDAERPADVPAGQDPQTATEAGEPLTRLANQFYGPAVDAQGNADCQAGQTGYPDGPLNSGGRSGDHVIIDSNTPGLAGGTYKARELGINRLADVP